MHKLKEYLKVNLKSQRGLTLVEIVIVLIILSVILSVVAGKLFSAGDKVKRDTNRIKMGQLKQYIQEYQMRYNSFPPTLDALVSGTGDLGDSFIAVTSADSLKDIWGNPYQYALENNGRSFRIKSLGSDGLEGGADAASDDTLSGP